MGLGKTYSTKYLVDSNGNTGAANQVLVSTATGVDWVDGSGSGIIGGPYLPLTAGASYPLTGDLLTSGNIYLDNNKTIFSKNTSGSNYGLLTITSGNVIKLGAYAYTSAATQIGLGDNGSFLIGSSTVMKIDSSGNVGIGTTGPSYKLDVNGSINGTSLYVNTVDQNSSSRYSAPNNEVSFARTSTSDEWFKIWAGGGSPATHRISIISSGDNTNMRDEYLVNTAGYGFYMHIQRLPGVRYNTSKLVAIAAVNPSDSGSTEIWIKLLGMASGSGTTVIASNTTIRTSAEILASATTTAPTLTSNDTQLDITTDNRNNATLMTSRGATFGGKVGIGTAAPGYKLTVIGDAGFSDWIYASKYYPTSSTTDILMQTGAGRTITLDPTSTGKVVMPNGNVGIGTTSPGSPLEIAAESTNVGNTLLSIGNAILNPNTRDSWIKMYGSQATVDKTFAVGNMYGKFVVNYLGTRATNPESGGTKMFTVDGSTGNVGINTTSPLGKLQVNEYTVASQGNQGVHGEVSVFADNGDESLFLGLKDSAYPNRGWAINPVAFGVNSSLQFKEHGSTGVRMVIESGGFVGLGVTDPTEKLHLQSTTSGCFIRFADQTASGVYVGSRNDELEIYAGNAERMGIDATGVVRFNAYNDANNTGTPTYLLGTDASGNIVKTNTVPGSAAGPYLPLSGGTMTGDIQMNEHSVKFNQSGVRSWDISAASGNLNITSGDSVGNVFLSPGLVVEDATTVGGNLTVTGSQYFNGAFIEGDGKEMFRYSDSWLRINEDNDFTDGIYCGTGILRTDGAFQVGSAGNKFLVTAAGQVTAASTITATGGFLVPYAAGTKKPMINLVGATTYGLWHTEATNDIFSFDFAGVSKQSFDQLGNATFTGQGFSSATSSGDGSSTLTTKGYVDGLITGATIYRGAWDPSGGGYGSPDLSTVTQTSGYYYICSAAGTAEPNGTGTEPDTWAVGDWVIYNDVSGTGQWQKIDNSSVLSGVGTGQTVALWQGASSVTDSETLGNAPITFSTNDSTFAGTITSGNIILNGSSRALTVTSSNDQVNAAFKCSNNAISRIGFQGSTSTNDYNVGVGADGNEWVAYTSNSVRLRIDTSGNATFAGTIGSGAITSTGQIQGTSFTDGYITWTAAQLNRYGAAIELQFSPTNASTLVKIGGNGSNPITFNAYTGDAVISGNLTVNGATTTIGNSSSDTLQLNGRFTQKSLSKVFIEGLGASGTQAREFEIARAFMDYNDWNSSGIIKVELMENYYDEGVGKEYAIRWGYYNTYDIDLINVYGGGDLINKGDVFLGTLTQVGTGDIYYVPIMVRAKYYASFDVLITTNRTLTTSSLGGSGTIYINDSPTPVNIADFTGTSDVIFSGAASNINLGEDTTKVGIGFADGNLPTQGLDVNVNTRLRGTLYDVNNAAGSAGDVLTSTGSGIDWVSPGTPGSGIYLPLAGGTMTGNTVHNDNVKSIYGTASDGLEIYHDGTDSIIADTGTGNLYIRGAASMRLQGINQSNFFIASQGGSVNLYYNNANKLDTTNTGINVTGDIRLNTKALLSNQENTDVDTGTETVANVLIASYTAAFFDFVIKKTTNVRSGTVYACHDGTNVVYTETSTNDLGDTSDVTLSVDISGGNMRLLATVTSDDWSVKSLIRAI